MKLISLLLITGLLLTTPLNSQEKWTCYTDKEELLVDNQRLLGAFDYVDGSTWFVTNKGINIYKDGKLITHNKKTEL